MRRNTLKHLASALALVAAVLAPVICHADWYMIGPRDFRPTTATTQLSFLSTGVRANASGYVYAKVDIPIGSTLVEFYCHAYDASTVKDINVNLFENTDDDFNSGGMRPILATNTSGSAGHVKVRASGPSGNAVIKYWDDPSGTGNFRYYTYYIEAMLDGTASTGIKTCAISYNPP